MRRTWAWWLVALSLILAPRPVDRAAAEPIRVLTLNLFHGGPVASATGDGERLQDRLAIVVAELQRLQPDVIALQEASIGSRRGHVAQRLARELGYHAAHASTTERVFKYALLSRLPVTLIDFSEGPAVLSRWPIVSRDVVPLTRCGRPLDSRLVLGVTLDTPAGPIQAYSTHTSSDACQLNHIERVASERRTMLPSILMGDFNASEGSAALSPLKRAFMDAFRAVVPGARGTGSVRSSRVVLNAPRRYADGTVLWPSDHYGVLAELELTTR